MMKQGAEFIVLEGLSGSGKTAQFELLKKKFHHYFFDREPSDELYGKVARLICERRRPSDDLLERCFAFGDPKLDFWNLLHNIIKKIITSASLDELEIQLLIIADRIYNLETKYLPNLEKGVTVIIDRYFQSLLAYGFSGGLDMEVLWDWQKKAFQSSKVILDKWKPDLVIIFDLDAEIAMKRLVSSDKVIDIFEEKIGRLEKIREGYRKLANNPNLSKKTVVIDANRSPEEIFVDVMGEINKIL